MKTFLALITIGLLGCSPKQPACEKLKPLKPGEIRIVEMGGDIDGKPFLWEACE